MGFPKRWQFYIEPPLEELNDIISHVALAANYHLDAIYSNQVTATQYRVSTVSQSSNKLYNLTMWHGITARQRLLGDISHSEWSWPVFCLLLGVSSDYAQPITGQVTEVTCPVIGQAQPELTPSRRQKTGPDHWHVGIWFWTHTHIGLFIFFSQQVVTWAQLRNFTWTSSSTASRAPLSLERMTDS